MKLKHLLGLIVFCAVFSFVFGGKVFAADPTKHYYNCPDENYELKRDNSGFQAVFTCQQRSGSGKGLITKTTSPKEGESFEVTATCSGSDATVNEQADQVTFSCLTNPPTIKQGVFGGSSGGGGSGGGTAVVRCEPKAAFFGFPTWYKYLNGNKSDEGLTGKSICTPVIKKIGDVWLILAAVIEILLRAAMLAAVIMVAFGGVKYITSQAQPDHTKAALNTIVNALIGLVIAVAATAMTSFLAGRFR
jgi:hypothetical protein